MTLVGASLLTEYNSLAGWTYNYINNDNLLIPQADGRCYTDRSECIVCSEERKELSLPAAAGGLKTMGYGRMATHRAGGVLPGGHSPSQADVRNNILAPDGPAWKALVMDSSQNLTLDGIDKVKDIASSGLPVVLTGGTPSFYATDVSGTDSSFSERLSSLLAAQSVLIEFSGLDAALASHLT
jgi:hypothetical protein